jgi:WD40 repeat protein
VSGAGEPPEVATPDGPFKGLASFEDSPLDELLFFGREREREVITANLVAARLTVLYGASGVGKTSLLAAGVARELRMLPERPVVVVHSGWSDPAAPALAAAIADAAGVERAPLGETIEVAGALHGELYLLLDQVEQYFVYHGTDTSLGDALAELVGRSELPVHVLIGIREDALARLDAFKGSVAGLLANRLRLEPLTRDQARRAIVGPLERFIELAPEEQRVGIEPELLDAVLDGVRAGALIQSGRGAGVVATRTASDEVEAPYLQVVMHRLWETEHARGSHLLRLETLERLGGPQQIVEEHLARALGVLTPAQKELAARMFNQLVTPSGTKIAHSDADLARYAGATQTELEPVLATLARERILRPIGDDGLQAHEIYHDVLADAVLAWRGRFDAERGLEQERRRHRRLLAVAIGALAVAAMMVLVSAYALTQRREARRRADVARAATREAEAAARDARAGELAATAVNAIAGNPAESVHDALAATLLAPSAPREEVLREALLGDRLVSATKLGAPLQEAAYQSDGRDLLVAGADGSVAVVDGRTGEVVRRLSDGGEGRRAVVASDGSAAVVFGAGPARLVLARGDGRPLGTDVAAAAFSGDGSTLATVSDRGVVSIGATRGGRAGRFVVPGAKRVALDRYGTRVFVAGSGAAAVFDRAGRRVVALPSADAVAFAFSPVDHVFAAGGKDRAIRIWDERRGLIDVLHGHLGPIRALAFSPKGSDVASASKDWTGRLWSVADGSLVATLNGHTNPVDGIAFNPTGDAVMTWSRDGTARVWKTSADAPGAPLATLPASPGAAVRDAVWGGRRIVATADADGSVRTWNVESQPLLTEVASLPMRLTGLAMVGGKLVARSGRRAFVIDPRTGRVLARQHARPLSDEAAGVVAAAAGRDLFVRRGGKKVRVTLRAPIVGVAVSRDGSRAAAASDSQVAVVSPSGRRTVLASPSGRVTSVAFSPDGRRVVSGTRGGAVVVWRTDGSGEQTFRPHSDVVADAQFSPDGRWIVTAGPHTASLIDTTRDRVVFLLRGHRGSLTGAAFDPSGRRIYTAGDDGTVRVYRCQVCGGLPALETLARRRLRALG